MLKYLMSPPVVNDFISRAEVKRMISEMTSRVEQQMLSQKMTDEQITQRLLAKTEDLKKKVSLF